MKDNLTHSDLNSALEYYFAFPNFRPGQRGAIELVLGGTDTLVVMPTGHGKSLIYQLSALLLPGCALVVSPLISLMKDQVDGLTRRDIAATYINSTLDPVQQETRLHGMTHGRYKIVLVAPERLRSKAFRSAISRTSLSMLVVDEAHCLSQWGHDFRPDYLHIAEIRRDYEIPVVLALTATATLKVQDDILDLLEMSRSERLVTGFNRPNLSLEVVSTPGERAKLETLHAFLTEADGAGIIYTGTRRDAEEVAEFASQAANLPARCYHAGLDTVERSEVQNEFMAGDLPLVAATNAFGMGIDRPDVRFVLHYTMPGSLEAYYQEAGRAGRDSLPARAVLLYSPEDAALHEYFIDSASPTADELRSVHNFIVSRGALKPGGEAKIVTFTLDELTMVTNLPEVKARVALEQLETTGGLSRLTSLPGRRVRVQPGPLSEQALHKVAKQANERKLYKRGILRKMVGYAQTNDCRRRTILDYFGDAGAADSPLCCDNCISLQEAQEQDLRPAETQAERAALIVLDSIKRLKWGLGKGKIARILKGSSAKVVKQYTNHANYGKFAALRISEIEALIDQLIKSAFIKAVGSSLPTLALTPKGEAVLEARAAIDVELRPVRRGAVQRLKAKQRAGGSVALTGQMLESGLNPEQIAAERALTVRTIYSHLSRLIADGRVHIDAVIPVDEQRPIRQAIEQVGSVKFLAPIKAILPDSVDWGSIRCVVEAWKLEHPPSTSGDIQCEPSPQNRTEYILALGESGKLEHVPELISALEDSNGNVRRLAASALGKLRSNESVDALLNLLEIETKPQVRQYTIIALGKIGDERSRTSLEKISNDKSEKEYNRSSAKKALSMLHAHKSVRQDQHKADQSQIKTSSNDSSDDLASDLVTKFLTQPHPRALKGPWLAGWALDFHSRFVGPEQVRGIIGDLVFRYKYKEEHQLAGELADHWVELLKTHPELPPAQVIVPVPPSTPRDFDPVAHLARALAARLDIPAMLDTLIKTRTTRQQKELKSGAAKVKNVTGAFALKGSIENKHLLLVDDLYDSGATLSESARTLARGRPASIVALALTKTIHADQ